MWRIIELRTLTLFVVTLRVHWRNLTDDKTQDGLLDIQPVSSILNLTGTTLLSFIMGPSGNKASILP